MADKTGLKNEEFLERIQKEGSTALKSRNPFGVNVFSGSVTDDGVVSGKVSKAKYDTQELLKSVDTNIFELLPPEIPEEPDVVPRPWYDDALTRIDELETDIEELNIEISDLTGLVNDLRITTQSLRIDLDGKDLIVASVENQNQQTLEQSQASIFDLQNSIQRATSEAIQRTSTEAINISLNEQIDALGAIIDGLNTQISSLNSTLASTQQQLVSTQNQLSVQQQIGTSQQTQGAFSNNEITAAPLITNAGEREITWRGRPGSSQQGGGNYADSGFINGEDIIFTNPTDNTVAVTVSYGGFSGNRPFGTISGFSLQAKETNYKLTLTPDLNQIRQIQQRVSPVSFFNPFGSDGEDTGELIFSSPAGNFSIPAAVQIQRGGEYG